MRSPSTLSPALASFIIQIVYLDIATLNRAGRRARKHSKDKIKALAKNLGAFGFVVPILIDENNKVLAGHARLDAAISLGMTQAPVVVISHLTEEQKRALIIADNRLAERAEWDREVLRADLIELNDLEIDFDLTLTGFTEAEVEAIVFNDGAAPQGGDKIPDPLQVPVTRLGDLWLLGDHKLLCADALQATSLERLMGGVSASVVFTDPPYNVPVAGHISGNGLHGEFAMASGEMTEEEFAAFLSRVCEQITTALPAGGLVYVCIDWRSLDKVITAGKSAGFQCLNVIVWDKGSGGMGSFYRSQHEFIVLFKKPGEKHTNRVELGKHGRDRTNVWAYSGVGGFGKGRAKARAMHPTVKPLALVRDALLDCTARGDVVLDLFGGSGTTIIAAEEVRRVGRAIELEPKYVDVAVQRWQEFTGRHATLAETGETFEEVSARRLAASVEEAA